MNNRINPNNLELQRAELENHRPKGIYVRRLKGGDALTFHCFSPKPWGVTLHYDQKRRRSSPHFTDTGRCPGCQERIPQKELYYLFGFEVEMHRVIFLELTPNAAKQMTSECAAGERLRGLIFLVRRTAANNGRLKIVRAQGILPEDTLPEDKDPHDTLMRLWEIQLDDPRGGLCFPTHVRNGKPAKMRE